MATSCRTAGRSVREQLELRQVRLRSALDGAGAAGDLERLLAAVDRALEDLEAGTLGTCDVCGEPIQEAEIRRHPMARYCLCELGPSSRRELERDLQLAWSIQAGLLPAQDLHWAGWATHYRYRPAGAVSGDLLDLATGDPGDPLLFLVGDVAGKGVAAGLVMAHVSALLRELHDRGASPAEMVRRLNAALADRSLEGKYATLVLGTAGADGTVELVNAGHLPPLLIGSSGVRRVAATGQPAGLFADAEFEVARVRLAAGDTLLLYSDGLVEARDRDGRELGLEELERLAAASSGCPPELVNRVLDGVVEHVARGGFADDTTVLALQRQGLPVDTAT